MTAEELLAQVEALGVVVSLDRHELVLRPKSLLTPELVEDLRAHKAELLDLVEIQSWPEVSRDAVRRFHAPYARLYPFLGRTILTPRGPGRLVGVLPEQATVVLETHPERPSVFLLSELGPPGVTGCLAFPEPRAH